MALAKNTRTNNIVNVPQHYIGHPVLGKNLVAVTVDEDQPAPKKKVADTWSAKPKEQPAPKETDI